MLFQRDMKDLYASWARVYDYFYPDRSDEVDFWERLASSYGSHVLDLMCGTAEVGLGLARRGHCVLGVDCSGAMLAVGAERLAAAADYPARNLSLALGDACAIPAGDDQFDFALVGGSGSFNHLDDNLASIVLGELARVLRPGGGLGMELLNPYLLKELHPVRTSGPLRPTPPGAWVKKKLFNRSDQEARLLHVCETTEYEIDGVRAKVQESFALRVRVPEEVQALLESAGFWGLRFYGDYQLGSFDQWSADLLVFASTYPLAIREV
jgi:ubiquinone/menaquinone biosynthesis C-methylase UbiE